MDREDLHALIAKTYCERAHRHVSGCDMGREAADAALAAIESLVGMLSPKYRRMEVDLSSDDEKSTIILEVMSYER